MSFRSEKHGRYVLRLAEPSDDPDIRDIFESGSFPGGLDVRFLRGESPLSSFAADGDRAHILVVQDPEAGRVIAVGGAVVRTEFLRGKPEKCAYLTGLKVLNGYRGRLTFIPGAYRLIHELTADCAVTYTTILDGNEPVIRMLEKRHRGMPEYRYAGHYTTYCTGAGKAVIPVEKGCTDGFERLFGTYFASRDLTPCSTGYAGFGKKEFYSVRGSDGEITACCFIGDQSATKYYRMCSYGGIYRLVSRLPTALFGYPSFPAPDSVIRSGIVSFLYVKDSDPRLCSAFLRSAAHESGFPMLLWGCADGDPLGDAVRKARSVRYGSRLYEVIWDGSDGILHGCGPEAALL